MAHVSARDVVVIGGGHNGLVAATYLARAGLDVEVLERRDIIGGACVTEEFAPGFRASPGAYVLSMLRPAIWRDFDLVRRGLRVDAAGPALHVFPDGSTFELHGDLARSIDAIRVLSPSDARAFPGYEQRLARIAGALTPLFDRPAPDPALKRAGDVREMLRLAGIGLRHRRDLDEMAYLFSTSAARYLDERFTSDIVKAALGWESISNTLAGPSTPGTAYGLLHEAVGGGSGGGVGWGFVRGGMGTLTTLLADAAREAGVTITTGAEVASVVIAGDRARGVELADGRRVEATMVASNADPKRTFLGLVGRDSLPSELAARLDAYRCEGASMKLNLAVEGLPRLRGDTSSEVQPYHRGLLQITKPLADLDADQASARRGRIAATGHMEVCIPSVHDPSLAPEGHHVVTVGVRSHPYRLEGTTWDDEREPAADRAIASLDDVMPGIAGRITAREVLTPLDLERRLALTGGHHLHGDMSPDQLLFLRPVRGAAGYRSPIRGLYLCGAGTHPGGGVTGANGRNAARAMIADAKTRRLTRRR